MCAPLWIVAALIEDKELRSDKVKRNRRTLYWSAGLAAAICISIVVIVLLSHNGQPEEGPYPALAAGEKLPDIGASWYRRPGLEPIVFEFDGPFPKMPSKMLVYKTMRPKDVTEAYIRGLAQKHFDVPVDVQFSDTGRFYSLKTQSHNFMYTSSTGFFEMDKYEKARAKLSEDRKDYPSDEECKRIAMEYLEKRDLLPEDAYLRVISDHTKSAGGMSVTFGRVIGEYKTWGPGSKIIVRVGVDGEIVRVSEQWLQYEPYKLAQIKTPQQAFEQLKGGNAFLGTLVGKVTKITLRYRTPPGGLYIQPIYYFEFDKKGHYAVVPAVKQEHLLSAEEMRKYYEEKTNNSGR